MSDYRKNWSFDWRAAIWAGLIAGTLATLAQVALWLVFTDDFPTILLRDAHLTAAMVLGNSSLSPLASFDVGVLLIATLIHFTLSILYAAVLIALAARLDAVPSLLAGISFGVALYVINLNGFTAIFPWFEQARGWITFIAHVMFGTIAIWVYRRLDVSNARSR